MNRLAIALVLAVAAGCSSGSAITDPVPSTTRPPDPATNPLEKALQRFGVDIESAPIAARQLGDAHLCGAEQHGLVEGRTGNPAARRCFVEGNAAGRPVVIVRLQSTVEGDPIVTIYRSGPSGSVEVFYDATRDKFGSGKWEHQRCTGITTEFPNAPAPLPDDSFEATGCAEVGESG